MKTKNITQSDSPRRIIVLGSTGSIGRNTLDVITHLNTSADNADHTFKIVGLSCGGNAKLLIEQVEKYNVKHVAIADMNGCKTGDFADGTKIIHGTDAASQLVAEVEADLVVCAMVGFAGLPAVLKAIELGYDIALANKETLVAAGEIVIPRIRKSGVRLLPIDSEHSAIFQCLHTHAHGYIADEQKPFSGDVAEISMPEVKRVVLTASGGPFRTWTKTQIAQATVAQALLHPTWNMGAKITIDSASMFNKGLELIEAHWLFGLESDRLEVIIHPQSVIHSFVEFRDGSVIAQMGPPDMKTPIQYALTYPQRRMGCNHCLDWEKLQHLDFETPDQERFPALRLAREVIAAGGTAGTILNAANEVAVQAFLDGIIPFGLISESTCDAFSTITVKKIDSLDDIYTADSVTRNWMRNKLGISNV